MTQKYIITDKAISESDSMNPQKSILKYGVIDTETNSYVRYPNGTICFGMNADDALDALLDLREIVNSTK